MNRIHLACTLTCLTTFLVACAGNDLQPDETETFLPRISANGSKFFRYQLDTPSGGAPSTRLIFDANESTDTNTAPEMTRYSAEDEKDRIERRVVALLEQKLAVTAYCREGYTLSERNIGFRRSLLSGECREAASEQDRAQFGNTRP